MVDIRQIYDKFPEEGGGLRDLYDQGPPHAFFLVKFWVRTLLLIEFPNHQEYKQVPLGLMISARMKQCVLLVLISRLQGSIDRFGAEAGNQPDVFQMLGTLNPICSR